MAQEIKSNLNDEIIKAINNGIKGEAERIYELKKREAMEEFDRRKDEVLAAIVLRITKMMDYQFFGDRMVITLITKED